jgi:hypothetical protein
MPASALPGQRGPMTNVGASSQCFDVGQENPRLEVTGCSCSHQAVFNSNAIRPPGAMSRRHATGTSVEPRLLSLADRHQSSRTLRRFPPVNDGSTDRWARAGGVTGWYPKCYPSECPVVLGRATRIAGRGFELMTDSHSATTTRQKAAEPGDPTRPAHTAQSPESTHAGLTQGEVEKLLAQYGFNEIAEKKVNPLIKFLSYFWGPIFLG